MGNTMPDVEQAMTGALSPDQTTGGVLLVGPRPPEPLSGGIEIGVVMLLSSSVAQKYRMQFFNTARRRDPSRSIWQRLDYQIRSFTAFAYTVIRQRPRVVHVKASWGAVNYSQSVSYSLIARLLGKRVLLQLHGGAFDTWYNSLSGPWRWAVRTSLSWASELVVLSQYWHDMVAKLVPNRPIHIVPNGVETKYAQPPARRGGPPLKVLTIGTLGRRKGYFDIIEAAAQLHGRALPFHFLFAGPDEDADTGRALREQVAALGLTECISFLGPVGREEKWRLLAEADIFLLPSYGENLPNAILEAMAAALPIICTPVGALPEMLDEGDHALFVPLGDIEALVQALMRCDASPELRAAMGAHNREDVAARYEFEAIARRFDDLYAETYKQ